MDFNTSDSMSRTEKIIRIATIARVDFANHRVKVASGNLLSDWLEIPGAVGNNFIAYSPLAVGSQVVIACPSGDFAQAIIIQVLYNEDNPPPNNDGNKDVIHFRNGMRLEFNNKSNTMDISGCNNIDLTSNNIKINCTSWQIESSNIDISAIVKINGKLIINGIDFDTHKHMQNPGDDYGAGTPTGTPM